MTTMLSAGIQHAHSTASGLCPSGNLCWDSLTWQTLLDMLASPLPPRSCFNITDFCLLSFPDVIAHGAKLLARSQEWGVLKHSYFPKFFPKRGHVKSPISSKAPQAVARAQQRRKERKLQCEGWNNKRGRGLVSQLHHQIKQKTIQSYCPRHFSTWTFHHSGPEAAVSANSPARCS